MTDDVRTLERDVLAIDDAVLRTTNAPGYGVTREGFLPKPFGRLLTEKLALSRSLFGDDLDLTSGSVIRKLLEVTALEETRQWAALAAMYDQLFVASASGDALSRLGEELGIPRPHEAAQGTIELQLAGTLPDATPTLVIPRGTRLLTPGGHHVATDVEVALSKTQNRQTVPVVAFFPGPEHNLNPNRLDGQERPERIERWHPNDPAALPILQLEADAAAAGTGPVVVIQHQQPLTGGDRTWPDDRYRQMLLRAPRSVWTVDAIETAVALVPGVRQVQVRDAWGGLDIHHSIFGNFNFIERVFGTERDLGSPYYFTVLVAPTAAAIWDGPDGLRRAIAETLEDLRPIGIFPNVEPAAEISVGLAARVIVRGIPLPAGRPDDVNDSPPARELKGRLRERVRRYVDNLRLGEPVRSAEIVWALMNEPGIVDVQELSLRRSPRATAGLDFSDPIGGPPYDELAAGANLDLLLNEVPVFVDAATDLRIV
jgi:hypothetical protein